MFTIEFIWSIFPLFYRNPVLPSRSELYAFSYVPCSKSWSIAIKGEFYIETNAHAAWRSGCPWSPINNDFKRIHKVPHRSFMYYLISTSTVMVPSMLGVVWSRRKHLTYICLGSIILEKVIWHSAHRELSWERAKRQELREPVWLLVLEHWWALPMWLSLFSWSLSLNVIIWSSLRLLKALFSQVFSSSSLYLRIGYHRIMHIDSCCHGSH